MKRGKIICTNMSHIEGETSEKGAREQRLTELFGQQRVEVRGEWKRLHNEQLYDLLGDHLKSNLMGESCGS